MVINYSHNRKIAAMRAYYRLLRDLGFGADTLMICSPGDPTHKEAEIIWMEVDGKPKVDVVYETVHDHPVKTIDEWCKEWDL